MKTLFFRNSAFRFPVLMLALVSALLAGCATRGSEETGASSTPLPASDRTQATPETTASSGTAPDADYKLDGNGFYRLLLGELALQDRQPEIALQLLGAAQEQYPEDLWILARLAPLSAQAGDLPRALNYYRQWAELAPTDPDAWHGVWQLSLSEKKTDLAWNALSELKALDPDYQVYSPLRFLEDWTSSERRTFYTRLADSGLPIDDSPDLQLLMGYLADSPSTAEPHWQRLAGLLSSPRSFAHYDRLLDEAQRPHARILLMNRAIEHHPETTGFYLSRAQGYLALDRLQDAFDSLTSGLDQLPDDPDLLRFTGEVAFQLERPDAHTWFEALLPTREAATAHFYLGRIAEQQGQFGTAFTHYHRVESSEWLISALQRQIGLLAEGHLPETDTEQLFSDQLADHPRHTAAISNLQGRFWYDAGNYRRAFDAFSLGLRAQPDNTDLLYMRALSAEPLSRLNDLESDLRQILAQNPDHTAALNALGYTLVDRTERIDEAAPMIEQAYAQEPDNTAIIDSIGWLRFHQGRFDESVDYLETAMDQDGWASENDEIIAHYVEALWQAGKQDVARQAATRWLDSHPREQSRRLLSVLERLGIRADASN